MASASDMELLTKIEALGSLISNEKADKLGETLQQIQNILTLRKESSKKTGKF